MTLTIHVYYKGDGDSAIKLQEKCLIVALLKKLEIKKVT
ncbi:antibiotic biosynthesis monooxygenase subfamily protein [Streptococcus pneumoniae]|nr:antibiotic biosynthesis monooxygenase subfamily protein [Streptococcus pneumoniae]